MSPKLVIKDKNLLVVIIEAFSIIIMELAESENEFFY